MFMSVDLPEPEGPYDCHELALLHPEGHVLEHVRGAGLRFEDAVGRPWSR